MARKSPSSETFKLLYVRSGNECAFPECDHPIFNDNGLYIAELCHIKAANKGGQRYDENQTDEERRLPGNLVFMCHRHHKETDCEQEYTVERLNTIKNDHESKFTELGRKFTQEMNRQILVEENYFWNKQSHKIFELSDLKIDRDFDKSILDLFNELDEHINTIHSYCNLCATSDDSETLNKDLRMLFHKAELDFSKLEKMSYCDNPFINRNWEMHNIGRPNFFSHISLCLNQLKVKTLEEMLKFNPQNKELKTLLETYRKDFETDYDNSYYTD